MPHWCCACGGLSSRYVQEVCLEPRGCCARGRPGRWPIFTKLRTRQPWPPLSESVSEIEMIISFVECCNCVVTLFCLTSFCQLQTHSYVEMLVNADLREQHEEARQPWPSLCTNLASLEIRRTGAVCAAASANALNISD